MRTAPLMMIATFLLGCSGSPSADAGGEADAGSDAGSAFDGGRDAGQDVELDAGPEIVDASTSAYATLSTVCQSGPFPRDDLFPEGCDPNPAPECPTAPSAGAVPVMLVATCAYGRDETGCEPISGGNCPSLTGVFYDFNLINPNPGAPIGCWARAHLFLEPNASGGVHVEYGGYPMRNEDCAPLGIVESELDIENMCCEQIIDLHFPHGEFTFRMAVRVDWTPP